MTVTTIRAVGFCAHYSKQGDWAFSYALNLAKKYGIQLNVFHFLNDPYDPDSDTGATYSAKELSEIIIEKEKKLRLYYDALAGDYLEVGFRLCYDNSWRELHRCLAIKEFQVLVLAKPKEFTVFALKKIEEFAHGFVCPVVLLGPGKDDFYLNSSASLLIDKLTVSGEQFSVIDGPAQTPDIGVCENL